MVMMIMNIMIMHAMHNIIYRRNIHRTTLSFFSCQDRLTNIPKGFKSPQNPTPQKLFLKWAFSMCLYTGGRSVTPTHLRQMCNFCLGMLIDDHNKLHALRYSGYPRKRSGNFSSKMLVSQTVGKFFLHVQSVSKFYRG